MIAQIRGDLVHKDSKAVVVDVGGVGYRVFVSIPTLALLPQLGGAVAFWTHLAVRETALDLYGFLDQEEMHFFELLITVSGIGPKSALSILGLAPVDTLRAAIQSEDTSYLTKVSGIGRKIAEKIVLELKEKIGTIGTGGKESTARREDADVLAALSSLGYSEREARDAIKAIPADILRVEERITAALKLLGS